MTKVNRDYEWDVDREAISVVHHKYTDNERQKTVSVRHATSPFRVELLAESINLDSTQLGDIGLKYLKELNLVLEQDLEIPDSWWIALSEEDGIFGWLSPSNPDSEDSDVRFASSFSFEREVKNTAVTERTIVLYATYRDGHRSAKTPFEWGVRVVFNIPLSVTGPIYAHITSSSFSLPNFDPESSAEGAFSGIARFLPQFYSTSPSTFFSHSPNNIRLMGKSYRDSHVPISPRALSYAGPAEDDDILEVRWRGMETSERGNKFDSIPVETITGFRINNTQISADQQSLLYTKKINLLTHGRDKVFDLDPSSVVQSVTHPDSDPRGPSATEDALRRYMVHKDRLTAELEVSGQFKVMESILVNGESPDKVKRVPLPSGQQTFPIRSNEQSALSAFHHFKSYFERLKSYGIDHKTFFRHIKLPLEVHYRATMIGGSATDGQTINAQVSPVFQSDESNHERPLLQIRFAQGTIRHRSREKWDDSIEIKEQAEPMGISLDPRWFWHEIGHVVLMGSVGELEFRFAHSMGDALSAIAMDPYSLDDGIEAARRGNTFPWISIARRHDREATDGWSWDGTFGKKAKEIEYGCRIALKGYDTEQILSSSLYRIYLSIGGYRDPNSQNSINKQAEREFASHYMIYLVTKATNLLGDARIVPANHPDQFVSALIDADLGTSTFSVQLLGDDLAPKHLKTEITKLQNSRIGGTLHKVIRWAFEVQGLYAKDTTIVNDRAGEPPSVDIYISDRRKQEHRIGGQTINYGPGNYSSISTELKLGLNLIPEADWLAAEDAIVYDTDTLDFKIKVGNRGTKTANSVVTTIWYKEITQDITELPEWNKEVQTKGWLKLAVAEPININAQSTTTVTVARDSNSFKLPDSAGLILCEVSCISDRSNIDPKSYLPCSHKANLTHLVTSDNNLGLVVHMPYRTNSTTITT